MYCPKCAAANNDDAKYCRVCGVNLSLVPQALTGKLPSDRATRKRERREERRRPSMEHGITQGLMGVGFALVALSLFFMGQWWGIFLLIPAFGMLGRGVASLVAAMNEQKLNSRPDSPQMKSASNTAAVQESGFSELSPPSVTETTTRQLDPPVRYPAERQ